MEGVSLIEIHGKRPRIHDSAFIAPGCRLIGDIETPQLLASIAQVAP